MNMLDQILVAKREELQRCQFSDGKTEHLYHVRSLKEALESSTISVIAEIKMKSPSEGDIFPNADPVQIAKDYESAGGAAISVLTDERFFGGSLEILQSVRKVVSIPVLRKDFILHPRQILDAASARADAFLLIAEALDGSEMRELLSYGEEVGLEALVEFHGAENAEKVAELSPPIVGVNCRNLETMTTDLSHLEKVFPLLPAHSMKVAESGIRTTEDLKYVSGLGYDAVLVGTSLMKSGNPGKALERLLEGAS